MNLEALRLQCSEKGHHRPVNDLDADEVLNLISNTLQNWSTARRNHNSYELEPLNLIVQSLRAESHTGPVLQYALSRARDVLFATLSSWSLVRAVSQRTYNS